MYLQGPHSTIWPLWVHIIIKRLLPLDWLFQFRSNIVPRVLLLGLSDNLLLLFLHFLYPVNHLTFCPLRKTNSIQVARIIPTICAQYWGYNGLSTFWYTSSPNTVSSLCVLIFIDALNTDKSFFEPRKSCIKTYTAKFALIQGRKNNSYNHKNFFSGILDRGIPCFRE